jgi:diacylglycerol kinase (ATP)
VVIAGPLSRRELLSVFPKVYAGKHVNHPALSILRTTSVLLEHSHVGPMPPAAFADGERIGPLPLRVEVRPGAVRLLA